MNDLLAAARRRLPPPLLILLIALPALQPLLRGNLTCGFDTAFHLWRAVEAESLLRAGVLLPRWAPHMAHGYGYPLFLFQGSFSAMMAAGWHLLGISWPAALNLTYGFGIVASGWSMWLLAREFWGDRGGIIAATAYIYAPFHAYVAYFRASLSETIAWALLPLLLWGLRRWQLHGQRRGLLTAVLTFALLFFTHDVTAYAAFPLLAGWTLFWGWQGEGRAAAVRGAVGFGLGMAAGAFFWLPALAERGQIQFDRAGSAWPFLYENNFLPWSQLLALPHNADPLLLNDWPPRGIGVVLAAAALGGLFVAWRAAPARRRWMITFLLLAALGYLFLTISWSKPLWDGVPLLAAFQFPWRMLAPATLLLALLTGGWADWRPAPATLLPALLLPALLTTAHWGWFYPQLCAPPDDISLTGMVAWERGTETLGTTASRELLPVTVMRMPQEPDTPPVWEERLAAADLPAGVVVESAVETLLRSEITLTSEAPFTARFRAFAFPGWRVWIDGRETPITPSTPEGLITFPVPAGQQTIEVAFGRTPLRRAADLLSLLALAGTAALVWRRPAGTRGEIVRQDESRRFLLWMTGLALLLLLGKLLLVDRGLLPPRQTALTEGALTGVERSSALMLGDPGNPAQVRLLGHDALPHGGAADQPLTVALYWQALAPLPADYRVGLRLVDADGLAWSLPGLREWRWGRNPPPTTGWPPDRYAQTAFFVDMLPGTPPGRYTLQLTMFARSTLAPLTFYAGGAPLGPSLPLGEVQIAKPERPWPADGLAPQYPLTGRLEAARILGSNIDRAAAAPGDGVLVTLFWETEGGTAVPLTLALVDDDGETAASWPVTLPDYGSGRWRLQEIVRLPVFLPGGVYRWQLAASSGAALGWGELSVVEPERMLVEPLFTLPVGETLGGAAQLVGAEIGAEIVPGGTVPVTLIWRAGEVMARSYRRFVQLLGPDGLPVAQVDGVPVNGTRPTTGWLPGEYLVDEVTLTLPPELPAGEYRLISGLYVAGDGRLTTAAGADFIELTRFTVPP